MAKLTDPQKRALAFLARMPFASPAELGDAMDDGTYKHGHGLSAQGAGRLGGTMASRLAAAGLAESCARLRGGFPAYRITAAGRAALGQL